ncbi:Di-trans-poly-cis-decaprenylcistransferase [Thelephora terrestris]|uniref:Alkyl transferase n=1 Tax=Thelephora terrestris TaxID=56493 RepID=A0A9P6HMN9_9AGAM|nr:Di-trans-poly-cis-decaprenylcistransferase [Thelephora terrestris]
MADLLNSAYDSVSSTFRRGLIKVLAAGPVPQHVAFVMDGNRRYARQRNMAIKEGHTNGFYALQQILEICLLLGVKCVTVFAFSIENFKRSEEEVGALMELAETKLLELTKHGEMLDQHGVRLNVLGRIEMLPENVQKSVRVAQEVTKNNSKSILNLCMPYTSRDEITTAVELAIQEKVASSLDGTEHPITEADIERYMMTTLGGSPPLDILIRSSGVKRLSDFLMWQASENVQLHFTPTYWPDIGFWDLLPVILDYQVKVWTQQGGGWGSDRWVSLGIECVALVVTVTLFASLARLRT